MPPSSLPLVILIVIIVALIADLFLMRYLKKRVIHNLDAAEIDKEGVYLFNTYSPVLTWVNRQYKNFRKGNKNSHDLEPAKEDLLEPMGDASQPEIKIILLPLWHWLERQGVWLQVSIIIISVFLYCVGILDFREYRQLTGIETQLFQAVDWLLYHALTDFHQFPLWNPYIHTGLPYIGDPMLHIYNPVITVPILFFGVKTGFKLALFFSFLLAALGMWRLGKVLGLGKVTSLWIALMFTFAGQPVARFFQGEYLFVFGFAWIPWIIVNVLLYMKERKRRYFAYSAFSLALLYFCGNAYYPFFMAIVLSILSLVTITTLKKDKPHIQIDKKLLGSLALLSLFSLGLIAIHLLPLMQFWPWMDKGVDIQGSHTLWQIWLDYTSKDTLRPDAYNILPAREEFYAYIGYTPFIGLLLLPIAIWKREKRPLLFLGLVILFIYLWIDVDRMPWKDFIYHTRFISQFRHVLRPLILGSFSIILLAGYGIDTAWKALRHLGQSKTKLGSGRFRTVVSGTGMGLLIILMAAGVLDVFNTNGSYVRTEDEYANSYTVTQWLREYDNSEFYVRRNPVNSWLYAVLTSDLRFIDAWYHWSDIRKFDGQINRCTVQARPKYVVQSPDEPHPEVDSAYVFDQVEGYDIYLLPQSLPMAFNVNYATLMDENEGELTLDDVIPQTPFFSGTNEVEVITQGNLDEELVLLITHYPGWRVTVDGRPANLENVGGYLATRMQKGVHHYRFEFIPKTFYAGLIISLLFLGTGIYLIVSDYRFNRRQIVEKWEEWTRWVDKIRKIPWIPETQNQVIVKGIFDHGVFQPEKPVKITEQSRVRLLVVADAGNTTSANLAWRLWKLASKGLAQAYIQAVSLAGVLFVLGMGVYLVTRFTGLDKFPIYFFTDEAIQTLSAADLVRDGFRDPDGQFLPTYFQNSSYYNLSLSVYAQVIPYLLFGKSIVVTRGVSALISILAAFPIGWVLKEVYKLSLWWLGPILLGVIPAWFLHSRTAFETVIFVSFYAACLLCYLLYRYRSPKFIYLTLLMAGLAFYSYSPGQVITAFTGLLLLVSDWNYHWKNRWILPGAILLFIVIALPYIRFRSWYGDVATEHLKLLASYWIQPIPFSEKITHFVSEYFYGLSPAYWFIPNQHDLDRHLMKDYGLISLYWLPFVMTGVGICLWKIRSSMHRTLLIALLAAPIGGALVGIGITRVLVMVVPATLLMALGLEYCFKWLYGFFLWLIRQNKYIDRLRNWKSPAWLLPMLLFILFTQVSFSMMKDALINGPTWYRDYGLGGLQYGAPQIFDAINEYLDEHEDVQIILSPSWANGADIVARFFLEDEQPVKMGSIDGYLFQHLPIEDNTVFVMIPDEYEKAMASGKFAEINVEKTLAYPDGRTGFYFTRVKYIDTIDQVLSREQEERRKLQEAEINWMHQLVHVRYSPLDMGDITLIFDGNEDTLTRTAEANPAIYQIEFTKPVEMDRITLMFGSTEAEVELTLHPADGSAPVTLKTMLYGTVSSPTSTVQFSQSYTIESFQLKLTDTRQGEPGNVHLWDIIIP